MIFAKKNSTDLEEKFPQSFVKICKWRSLTEGRMRRCEDNIKINLHEGECEVVWNRMV